MNLTNSLRHLKAYFSKLKKNNTKILEENIETNQKVRETSGVDKDPNNFSVISKEEFLRLLRYTEALKMIMWISLRWRKW